MVLCSDESRFPSNGRWEEARAEILDEYREKQGSVNIYEAVKHRGLNTVIKQYSNEAAKKDNRFTPIEYTFRFSPSELYDIRFQGKPARNLLGQVALKFSGDELRLTRQSIDDLQQDFLAKGWRLATRKGEALPVMRGDIVAVRTGVDKEYVYGVLLTTPVYLDLLEPGAFSFDDLLNPILVQLGNEKIEQIDWPYKLAYYVGNGSNMFEPSAPPYEDMEECVPAEPYGDDSEDLDEYGWGDLSGVY